MIIRLQPLLPHPLTPPPPPSSQTPNSSFKPQLNPNTNPNRHSSSLLKGLTPLKTLAITAALPTNLRPDSGLLFRQKLLYLENLNINSTKALNLNPNIRSATLHSIKSVEKCLYSMGIQQSEIGRILDMYPQLLTCDIHTDLYPIFDFLLHQVKIPFHHVRKAIVRCPRLLICSVDNQLKPTLGFLRGLGFVGSNAITSQTTMLLVSNVEGTLIPKIEYLANLGIEYKEVVKMVLRSPGLLTFSIANNFEPKVEYFLNEMKGDLEELRRFPQYFSFSLEGKIKPRHRMLVEHVISLPLSDMLKVSDGRFESWLLETRLKSVDKKSSL